MKFLALYFSVFLFPWAGILRNSWRGLAMLSVATTQWWQKNKIEGTCVSEWSCGALASPLLYFMWEKRLLSCLSYYILGSFSKSILNCNTIRTKLMELSNLNKSAHLGRDKHELNKSSVHIVMNRIEPKSVNVSAAGGKALPCHPCTPATGAPGW